jgi:hypothetical protein
MYAQNRVGSPLPVVPLSRDAVDELADDLRAYVAFLGPRAATGPLVVKVTLEGGKIRRWVMGTEEHRQPTGRRGPETPRVSVDTLVGTGVESSK